MEEQKPAESLEAESLDNADTGTPAPSKDDKAKKSDDKAVVPTTVKKGFSEKFRGLITHLNIYLLLFIVIVILSAGVVLVAFQTNKKASKPTTVTTQPLTTEELQQINGTDSKVGDPKQTLTIESNAIFSGKVLIKDSLDVAGTIKVGGALSLPGISVSGSSNFDQIQANNLSITGNVSVQGQLTVAKTITASAGATFGGPISAPMITTQQLQLTNDLQITKHLDAGGPTPSKTDGSALGNGGTSSISGTDTAGTATINTGGSPGAGCFMSIKFTQQFSGTPHIVITPVGTAAAGLNYYVNRTATDFSICTTNAAPAGQTFSFDFVAID